MEVNYRKFGQYIIEKLLGVGGAGRVYLVRKIDSNYKYALKVISISDSKEDSISRRRFHREFRAALRLSHDYLVKVYEFGICDNQEYYTMEYIDGTDLENHLNLFREALNEPDSINKKEYVVHCLDLLIQVAEALAYLHENRFVHRDLKPGNILITKDNRVKLTDFGLIRDIGSLQMTQTGTILGTVEYMSPEQTITAKVDARSDIYSLGVIAFKMFTGVMPFSGGMMRQLIARTQEDAPSPQQINAKLDPRLAEIISQMLKRRPEERFSSAQQLLKKLTAARKHYVDVEAAPTDTIALASPPKALLMLPACIGRDKELRLLEEAIDKLLKKESSLFLISGESGIGKSRLVEEARTIAAYHRIIYIKSVITETPTVPGAVWLDIISRLKNEFQKWQIPWPAGSKKYFDLLEELSNILKGKTKQKHMSREALHYRFLDTLLHIISLFSKTRPLFIHMENAHFADPDCLDIIFYIIHQLITTTESAQGNHAALFIITYRNDLPGYRPTLKRLNRIFNNTTNTTRISLERLSQQDVNKMIASMLGGEHASPKFNERIYQETNGNPLFVESMITSLVEDGRLRKRGDIWVGVISQLRTISLDSLAKLMPSSVKESIRRRIEGLSDTERCILHAAAILGSHFSFNSLVYLLDKDEDAVLDALDSLLRKNILQEADPEKDLYAFTTNLLQECCLANIPEVEMKKYHERAAKYFEEETTLSDVPQHICLAEHLFFSGNRKRSLKIFLDIIDHYVETGNFYHGSYYIDQVLQLFDTDEIENIYGLFIKQAQCLYMTGRLSEAHHIYSRNVRNLSRLMKQSSATLSEKSTRLKQLYLSLHGIATLLSMKGRNRQALRILYHLLSLSPDSSSPRHLFSTHVSIGNILLFTGDSETAQNHFEKAIKIARKLQAPDLLSRGLKSLSNVFFFQRNYKEAENILLEALPNAEAAEHIEEIASIKSNLACIYNLLGKHEKSLPLLEEAVSISESSANTTSWAIYLHNLASTQKRLNRRKDALLNYQKALALFEEQENNNNTAMCLNNLGLEYLDQNRLDDALMSFRKAFRIYLQQGTKLMAANAVTNMGYIYRELGDTEQALNACSSAEKLFREIETSTGIIELRLLNTCLLIDQKKIEAARIYFNGIPLEKHQEISTEGHYYLTRAELLLAENTSPDQLTSIVTFLEKASACFKQSNFIFFYRKALRLLGRFLIKSGIDPDRGRQLLNELEA